MTARATLPLRRPNATRAVAWDGHAFGVTVGLDPATGRPAEVFADLPKGGQMQAVLSDACVIVSIALQHGISVAALGKSLGRVPLPWGEPGATAPASPVGAILDALRAETEQQP